MTRIALSVNGERVEAEVEPRTQLADFLREHLLLTGTHVGCEHGICGACTVVIDGEIARSCITYAVACEGASVRTIESFDDDLLMGRLRAAFTQEHALQCGYCTPGMLIAARDLVRRKGDLSDADIRVAMSGNLCRCTGYLGIVNAVKQVMAGREAALDGVEPPAKHLGALIASAVSIAPAKVEARAASTATSQAPAAGGDITLGADATRLTQTIRIAHPPAAAWEFMRDVEKVAACLPGVTLDGPERDGRVGGRMAVKLGPITPTFAGAATVRRFDADQRMVLAGRGGDMASASRASGEIDYCLFEDGPDATRIEVAIRYALTGPLAQFGRSGLVKDLVARIAAEFARNLESRLSQPAGSPALAPAAALNAGGLFFRILWQRLQTAVRRLVGRG
jgi:carbon-monoxide dehydrogenase small subunit